MSSDDILNREEDFHDEWAKSINIDDVMVDEFFEACTSPENRRILEEFGDINGKKILELGCGAGEASVYFAKKGADVTASDLSKGMLEVVKKLSKKHGVSLKTMQCSSHDVPFKDESFDIVYAANLLHHVDIENTIAIVKRVLKNDGIFVSWDPLEHNPLIKLYRKMASGVRTEDEHPIRMKQLKIFRDNFSEVKFFTTWFFTLFIFVRFYLIDRVDPNKERYWKKILTDHRRLEKTYLRLEKLDRIFLKIFPFLRRYCWNIVIWAKK